MTNQIVSHASALVNFFSVRLKFVTRTSIITEKKSKKYDDVIDGLLLDSEQWLGSVDFFELSRF